jgi:hypothetical protein
MERVPGRVERRLVSESATPESATRQEVSSYQSDREGPGSIEECPIEHAQQQRVGDARV